MDSDVVFYRELPKVELHAHLNGSVSAQTIEKLISRKPQLNIERSMTAIGKGQRRTLDECFEVFKVIHKLVDTEEDILMVATDVIREFAADNVKYLELRSTPREEKDTGLTKKSYIETVIKAIQQCKDEGVDIDVRFLVAIDRRNGTEVALETVNLAEEFMLSSDGLVVGVDLSGDPTEESPSYSVMKDFYSDGSGHFQGDREKLVILKNFYGASKESQNGVGHGRYLLPALQKAKSSGLKLSLHLSEIPSQLDETDLLLSLPPDRIGHGTFLHPDVGGSQSLVDKVVQKNIPIELCLTSNVKGKTVPCYSKHHFKYWYELGHPTVLCTDDKGVFCTELSQEYQIAASTFGLSREAMWKLSEQAIDCIFGPESVKQQLRQKWNDLHPQVFK